MIVELASLPPIVQAYIQQGEQVSIRQDGQEVAVITTTPAPKSLIRVPNLLAHLVKVSDDVWFEPMSDEELAWWNGGE
ncbi:MAG: hypothetical protein Q4C68_05785 [Moraxella sp.]|nr:hypothetical protein [Moraxella sp.]